MDTTYQYLVFLADVRIKFDIPVGGAPSPKPLLNYLQTLLDAKEKGLNVTSAVEMTAGFLKEYVHTDTGVDIYQQTYMLHAINKDLMPQMAQLQSALAFVP